MHRVANSAPCRDITVPAPIARHPRCCSLLQQSDCSLLMPMLSQHSRGLLLAMLSVIVISPDALLLVEMSSHASPATVLFWKCIAVGCLSLLHGALWNGCHGLRSTLEALPPLRVLTLWTLQAVSVSGFALSVLLTTPARAMIFISLNPCGPRCSASAWARACRAAPGRHRAVRCVRPRHPQREPACHIARGQRGRRRGGARHRRSPST